MSARCPLVSHGSARQHPALPDTKTCPITVGKLLTAIESSNGHQPGDPAAAVAAIVQLAASEEPPLRLQLGSDCVALVESKLDTVRDVLDRWWEPSLSTDYPADAS
jgi:hypothetical protein